MHTFLRCFTSLLFLLLFSAAISTAVDPPAGSAPWRELFNGRDLSGWSLIGGGSKVWVEDGAITGHMVRGTAEHTLITTDESFGDFILEAECRDVGALHSGFLLRCVTAPAEAHVRLFGYQVKIDPTERKWTGGIFDDFGKNWNWMYNLADDRRAREAYRHGEWNHFRIEAIGRSIKVWVNEVAVTHLLDDTYVRGPLALKVHSLPADAPAGREADRVSFRHLRIVTDRPGRFARSIDLPAREALPPVIK